MHAKILISAAIIMSCAASFGARAQPQEALPSAVIAAVQESRKLCEGEKIVQEDGFITRKDVNGDGKDDYILHHEHFTCDGRAGFCGSPGCTIKVVASLRNGQYAQVFDGQVRSLQFATKGGRPRVRVETHGMACNQPGFQSCYFTRIWNGQEFAGR